MNHTQTTSMIIGLAGAIAAAIYLHAPAFAAEDRPASPPANVAGGEGGDVRTPLPLTAMMAAHQKANMRDHLAAVQEIVAALAADDMTAVEKAARRIGYSDTMAQMCQHMGAAAPGFTDIALSFHRTADTIADAAQRGDRKAATAALAATLSASASAVTLPTGSRSSTRQPGNGSPQSRPLPAGGDVKRFNRLLGKARESVSNDQLAEVRTDTGDGGLRCIVRSRLHA